MLSEFEVIPIIFLGGDAFCARRYNDRKYAKRHKRTTNGRLPVWVRAWRQETFLLVGT